MKTFEDLKNIIDNYTYEAKNNKDECNKMKYAVLSKPPSGKTYPKEVIKQCEAKIIKDLNGADTSLMDLIGAYNHLFSLMYDARENNNIKSKFKDFYKNNKDFFSVMNHEFPNNSTLSKATKKLIKNKIAKYGYYEVRAAKFLYAAITETDIKKGAANMRTLVDKCVYKKIKIKIEIEKIIGTENEKKIPEELRRLLTENIPEKEKLEAMWYKDEYYENLTKTCKQSLENKLKQIYERANCTWDDLTDIELYCA